MAALFIFPPTPLDKTGLATEAKQDAQIVKLQSIVDEINNLEIDVENININVDGLETLVAATNTALDDVNLALADLNTTTTDIEADLITIVGHVDGIETLIGTSNSTLTNINNNVGYSLPKLDIISQKTVLNIAQVSSLIDSSITAIPTTGGLTVFAAATDDLYKFQTIDEIGEYMALCVGASGSEAVVAALPLGGGEVFVNVPQGARVSIKSLTGSNITSGKIIVNAMALGQP